MNTVSEGWHGLQSDCGKIFSWGVTGFAIGMLVIFGIGAALADTSPELGPDVEIVPDKPPTITADKCLPLKYAKYMVENKLHAHKLRPVSDDKIEEAAKFYNTYPPASDEKWDSAWLADFDKEHGFLLVGKEDKVCASLGIADDEDHKDAWQGLLRLLNDGDDA